MNYKTALEAIKNFITFISKVKVATLLFIIILVVIIFGFKIGIFQGLKETNVTVDFAPLSKNEEKHQQTTNTTSLKITDVRITPAKFSIPSYLYFKIKNNGFHDANKIYVNIDLGTASVVNKDVRQAGCDFTANISESLIELKCDVIRKDQSIDVYLLTTYPTFNSIIANGDNIYSGDKITLTDISNEGVAEHNGPLHDFIGFLYVLAAFVLIVITLTLMNVIGGWLFSDKEENKK